MMIVGVAEAILPAIVSAIISGSSVPFNANFVPSEMPYIANPRI